MLVLDLFLCFGIERFVRRSVISLLVPDYKHFRRNTWDGPRVVESSRLSEGRSSCFSAEKSFWKLSEALSELTSSVAMADAFVG